MLIFSAYLPLTLTAYYAADIFRHCLFIYAALLFAADCACRLRHDAAATCLFTPYAYALRRCLLPAEMADASCRVADLYALIFISILRWLITLMPAPPERHCHAADDRLFIFTNSRCAPALIRQPCRCFEPYDTPAAADADALYYADDD